ncbi:hypothetical protein [Ornithinibacillus bavariensis]|uniref:hypothetical protein n=1 Tax=Ornithinibacillus bavariensis TaxID=545502 RepID=UPI003D263961
MREVHVFNCLFENEKDQELIYVFYEDTDGYIHYHYCDDGTQQIYTMTSRQLSNYKRVW